MDISPGFLQAILLPVSAVVLMRMVDRVGVRQVKHRSLVHVREGRPPGNHCIAEQILSKNNVVAHFSLHSITVAHFVVCTHLFQKYTEKKEFKY